MVLQFFSIIYIVIDGHRNFIFDFALSKLYSNCLLTTLNSRASIQLPTDYSAGLNPTGLTSRRDGMPPRKQSASAIEFAHTEHSTGFCESDDHDSKRLEQSTNADGTMTTKVRRRSWNVKMF